MATILQRFIWRGDLRNFSFGERLLKQSLRIGHAVLCDLRDGQLSLRAMSLVYTTIISLVPLLALSFSVLKGFGVHEGIRPMLESALAPLGEKSAEITENIIGFVDNIQVGVLGALGLALLIYSVVAMMQKIENAFNYTWHIDKPRSLSQRFSDYLSVLLVGPLFIFLSVGITTSLRFGGGLETLEAIPGVGHVLEVISLVIPYVIMGAGFAFIYFYMPNTKVNISSAFVGGMVTAVMWKLMGWVFTTFIASSSSHTAVYSAFASVIIFMVFLYIGWLVLLLGASIAYYHQRRPKSLLARQDHLAISPRVRERTALLLMALIGRAFAQGKEPVSRHDINDRAELPGQVLAEILGNLEQAQLIREAEQRPCSHGEFMGFVPARPLENITLQDILAAVHAAGETEGLAASDVPLDGKADKIWRAACSAQQQKAGKTTLNDLIG